MEDQYLKQGKKEYLVVWGDEYSERVEAYESRKEAEERFRNLTEVEDIERIVLYEVTKEVLAEKAISGEL